MKVTILCDSENHPINSWLEKWVAMNADSNAISLIRNKKDLDGGDILFLISCNEIINRIEREQYKKTLVIHASDLPKGRGWSPHINEIINGNTIITVTLLEAAEKVDSGDIWKKIKINIPKTDLYDELNSKLFYAELELMDFALSNFETIKPVKQDSNIKPTYYNKRTSKDSEISITENIKSQIDLIRVCDPNRFPSFFYYEGQKYNLYIEKADEDK